jgi:colanic acid/amylovoran biosynthesis glycosyltransferase
MCSSPLLPVATFVERYLRPTQTFIYRQMQEIPGCQVQFIARYRLPDTPYPTENVRFLNEAPQDHLVGVAQTLFLLRRRLTGRYAFLNHRETRALRGVLDETKPAVMHSHWGPDAMCVAPVCFQRRLPHLVHFHGYDVSRLASDERYRHSLHKLFKTMSLAITVSEHMRQRVIALGCPPERVACHHTGVPEQYFASRQREFRADNEFVIVQAGRMNPKKGHRYTLEALATLRSSWPTSAPRLRLVIAGTGPEEQNLRRQIEALHLADCVDLLGYQTQEAVLQWMCRADTLIVPSHTAPDGDIEGVPNVVVEALAAGLPIVATDHGGIPEPVRYSERGWLVPEKDSAALADRLRRLALTPNLQTKLSNEGRIIAREGFHLPTQNARLAALYQHLHNGARTLPQGTTSALPS